MKKLAFALAFALAWIAPATGGAENRCANIEMTPSEKLQIVAWVETASGQYVDTAYITQQVGRYGLGNRPGRWDFNSGPMFPYGRRSATFPVWSHHHGQVFDAVVFQNCCSSETDSSDDPNFCETLTNDSAKSPPYDREYADCGENNLSHPFNQSSREQHYCQPLMPTDPKWAKADAMTCATVAFTDKGKFSTTGTSLYPPRTDLTRSTGDSPDVGLYGQMNPFDAVSQATPPGGVAQAIAWPIPDSLPPGSYVLWVEVAKEFDQNATYSIDAFPRPAATGPLGISWSGYGKPYRGQPSIVYQVPFDVSSSVTTGLAASYAGYGDPLGKDGTVRPPDATITTDTPGSGASRLQMVSDGGSTFRVRVTVRPNDMATVPGPPQNMMPLTVEPSRVTLQFIAPGDGPKPVAGYDVRVMANAEMTPDTYETAMKIATSVTTVDPGQMQTIELPGLLPETDYWIGIRAYDGCRNYGELSIVKVTTADRIAGEVDACFVATAAYGSLMANDVELLRHVRDSLLRRTVIGELAVETYYTFGPPVAGIVGESDVLRASARAVLAPIIATVRALSY